MHQILIELRSIYDEFLNSKITSNMHDTMLYRDTIEHVVLGYFYGADKFDEIFLRFVQNADRISIAHCSFFVYTMMNNKDVQKYMDKIYRLWKEHKFIESYHTEKWFTTSPINETSINLYLNYIKTSSKEFYCNSFPTKTFYKYIDKFPLKVAMCIEVFVDRCIDGYPSNIHQMLSDLCKHNNSEINEICKKINKICNDINIEMNMRQENSIQA